MAKLSRQTLLWFGSNSDSSSIGVYGSLAAGSPTYSKVIATIQSLAAWGSGWKGAIIASERPALQDFNALQYVHGYELCYLFEMGIPEWDSGTVYYQNSFCQVAGTIYYSLQDNNQGNSPASSPTYWTAKVSTDGTMVADSDVLIPSQKAVVTYVAAQIATVPKPFVPTAPVQAIGSSDQNAPGSETDMPDMSITLTTKGTRLLCAFTAPFSAGGSSPWAYLKLYIDGSSVITTKVGSYSNTTSGYFEGVINWLATGLTPGSHTIKIRWYYGGGSQIAQNGSTDGSRVLIVQDLA